MQGYLYFHIPGDEVLFHFMGEPPETRHNIVPNEEAVLSPSWSPHSGVGTRTTPLYGKWLGRIRALQIWMRFPCQH